MKNIFWKIDENETSRTYILRNWVKIMNGVILLILLFGNFLIPQSIQPIFFILFILLVVTYFLFGGVSFRFATMKNEVNGKKITYSGGLKALISSADYSISVEK